MENFYNLGARSRCVAAREIIAKFDGVLVVLDLNVPIKALSSRPRGRGRGVKQVENKG